MGRRYRTVALIVGGIVACGGSPQTVPTPDDAVLLRLAPPAGQVSHYRTVERSTIELSTPMLDAPISSKQTQYHTYRVLEVLGDRRVIERTVDSMTIDASGAPATFRRTVEEAARRARGSRDTLTLDVLGETITDAGDAAPGDQPEPDFTPTGLLDLIDHPLGLPEGPVRPGESWTAPRERRERVSDMGEVAVRVEATYQLDRVEVMGGTRRAFVRYDATIAIGLETDPATMIGMEMEFDGTESGEVVLDLEAGRVVRSTSHAIAEGVLVAMGMDLTMSMEMVSERALVSRP